MNANRQDYDLIMVGTGFASTFFLKKYLEKSADNVKVLVLERGFPFMRKDRLGFLQGKKTPDPRFDNDPESYIVNETPDKHWLFTVGHGGSSNCWYACTPRFMPADFKLKSKYGVGEDWPLDYDELDPFYTEVETLMDISGPAETPFPKKSSYPLPPHQFTTVDKVLKQKYGSLYISQPTGRASRAVKARNACCANATCSVCPVDAKFTIENSGFGVYEDPRVELKYDARVFALDLKGSVAERVHYREGEKDYIVAADVIALGANALFNANILLNSGDGHPLTGKGLGEQYGMDVVVHLKDFANVGGSTWVNANGYMLYDGEHRREFAACLIESNNAPYIRVERGKWRNLATFRMIFEDLPQNRNYVARSEDLFKPVTHFEGISEYTTRAVKNMKEKLPALLDCLPVEEIKYMDPFKTEAHILGTTRMHADPSLGVVDKHQVHHRYRNLFVLGGGSFTTFSPNNPTLTISALSLYSAEKLF